VAQGLLRRAVIGLPLDEPIVAAKRYFELNAGQIKEAFARHLRMDDFVQIVRGPAPQ
jgi:zinc protease